MMFEAEDRAKDTEVDGGTSRRPTTGKTQSESAPRNDSKPGENTVKNEGDDTVMNGSSGNGADEEGDSEAETLIQSPEKRRSIVESAPSLPPPKEDSPSRAAFPVTANTVNSDFQSRKRKRSAEDIPDREASIDRSRRSSPLSSPVAFAASIDSESDRQSRNRKRIIKNEGVRIRRNGTRDQSQESEVRVGGHGMRQRRPSDIIPHKRDKHNLDSAERRETRSATYSRHTDDERSPSPRIPRSHHKRGVSTQLTAHEFVVKKRGRPPLINTRRNRSAERATSRAASMSSDDSNSPAPPRSALSKLTSHDQDTMSPAKTGPRKWRDKNGRTFLARACNNNDLESAKARLAERPEDLNWADNAGNTPLQIAALEGFIEIVKFLLEAGCDVDTRNIDKETPLIDAVENGHVEVVKLLLEHGANPRLGNAKGDEPYELVPQDDENYEEIRALLVEAKERESRKHKAYEQIESSNREGSSRAASAASPRDSPPIGPRSPPAITSRRRTGRSESTRNDLLWQANTQENLTKLAGKGDVQGVASILNILQKAETESLIAAAKAGHEEVLQYLLAMGDPDPDPDPVRTSKPGHNTPILAAIGRGHPEIVKLLVTRSGFNPTKKIKDKTYFELARERKGEDWQQEYEILKAAYENYATSKGRKTNSPRKTRDAEKVKPRPVRRSSSPVSHKRMSSSPTMTHKSLPSTKSSESSPQEKRKPSDVERRKISSGKSEVGDSTVAVASDLDQTVTVAKKTHRVRRSHSDLPTPKMEPETLPRRRRLVTGKEHRRNKSSAPGSDSDEGMKEVIVVKQEDKPIPNLKRARSRSSMSVEPKPPDDADKGRFGPKKRRTLLESSPDEARNVPRIPSVLPSSERIPTPDAPTPSIEIPKQEEDVENVEDVQMSNMGDNHSIGAIENENRQHEANTAKLSKDQIALEPDRPEIKEAETRSGLPQENESVQDIGDRKKLDAEREEAIRLAKEQADREAQAKAQAEQLAKIEAERVAAEAAAAAEAEAKAMAQRAEEERKAAEEEERRIAELRQAEEVEMKRKAEQEALRKKEEEDRQEQLRRDEEDRRRMEYLENERQRRETLPIVLSKCAAMIDENNGSAQSPAWLSKFLPLFTVKTQQLAPTQSNSPPDEEWVANFQVAGLLATKDLNLRNFTSFDKRNCTPYERQCLWRVARNMLSFEYEANGINTSVKQAAQRENENRPKFLAMEELFWVKLSDFTDQVMRHPHLAGLILRTRPISLASYASLAQPRAESPQINGASSGDVKLANGIHNHNSPANNGMEQTST